MSAPLGERKPARSARRRARELALQGCYEWLVKGGSDLSDLGTIDAHMRDDPEFGQADAEFFRTLLFGATREADDLRDRFGPHIDRPVSELSPVEHAILLLGSYELVHKIEVPYKVVINEAVELAKSFGGTDGFKFINGVLDKLAPEVRAAEVASARRR